MSCCVLCMCVGLALFVAIVVVSLWCCVSCLESSCRKVALHGSKFTCSGCVFVCGRLLVIVYQDNLGRVFAL